MNNLKSIINIFQTIIFKKICTHKRYLFITILLTILISTSEKTLSLSENDILQLNFRNKFTHKREYFQNLIAQDNLHVPDPKAKAWGLFEQAHKQQNQGQLKLAFKTFQQALTIFQDISNLYGEGLCLLKLGSIEQQLVDYEGAIKNYHKSLKIWDNDNTQEAKELQGATLSNIGDVHRIMGEYEQAMSYHQQALTIAKTYNIPVGEAQALNNLGLIDGALGNYKKAQHSFQKARAILIEHKIFEGLAPTFSNIGYIFLEQGKIKQALEYFQLALGHAPSNFDKAQISLKLAEVYQQQGNYQKAFEIYQIIQDYGEKGGDVSSQISALNGIGTIYNSQGKYDKALNTFEEAKEISQNFSLSITIELLNIAAVYNQQSRYLDALKNYQHVLKIAQNSKDKKLEGQAYNNIGAVYRDIGNYPRAIENYEEARKIFEGIGIQKLKSHALNNLGDIYHNLEDYAQALDYYQQALDISKNIQDEPGIATTLINIGEVQRRQDQFQEALNSYNEALINAKKLGILDVEGTAFNNIGGVYNDLGKYQLALRNYKAALKIAEDIQDIASQGTTLSNIATVYHETGYRKQAISYYKKSIDIIESIQGELKIEELKTSFAGDIKRSASYILLVDLLWDGDNKERLKAFEYVERAKARAFLDQIASGRIDSRGETNAKLQALKDEINALNQKLNTLDLMSENQQDKNIIKELKKQRDEKRKEYKYLRTELKISHPETASLETIDVASLSETQKLLDADTTLVEYFVTPRRTFAFVLTKNSFQTIELKKATQAKLKEQIELFGDLVDQNPHPNTLKKLYELLILDLKDSLKTSKIAIVPHSYIHYVPFAALTDGYRYLSEDKTIFILPSASILKVLPKPKIATGNLLALGIKSFEGTRLRPLKYAKEEVRKITSVFKNTKPYLDDEATESLLKNKAQEAEIIHLATHGKYNKNNPLFSSIYLSSDSQNDGKLQVHEIYDELDLTSTTNLVVLSACETNLGELSQGDEIVGLTRALLYAGTPSVIGSLWNVNDNSTALLMERFYINYQQGMNKAQALKEAQKWLRKKHPEYASPLFWASFSLTGNPKIAP